MDQDFTARQRTYVRNCFASLLEPEQTAELRAIDCGGRKVQTFVSNSVEALAQKAVEFDAQGAKGVYFTPNPLRPDLIDSQTSARKADVVRRLWLLVDIDPIRADGSTGSATQAERQAAWVVADVVQKCLESSGLSGAVVADSGNGWHLMFPIWLDNDDTSQALVKAILHGLAERCNMNGAKVDTSCHDPGRIWKVYGTMARKGQSTDERPHRYARMISGERWDRTRAEANNAALVALAELWAKVDRLAGGKPAGDPVERARAYLAKVPPTVCGTQSCHNNTFKVAGLLARDFALTTEQALPLLREWADRGTHKWTDNELRKKFWDGAKSGSHELGAKLESPALPHEQPLPNPDPPSGNLIIRASQVTPRQVEWLWPGTVPLGKLTTFAGQGGVGKTFCLLDLAARVSLGGMLPLSTDRTPQGQTLFISGEDDPEDTLVPRLIELGADLQKIVFLTATARDNFTLAALKLLTAVLGQIGSDTRLVVIDPPASFLGGVDDHKNAELRRLLTPLAAWASEQRVSVIFNSHMNKSKDTKEAMQRVMGSVAWVNGVRAAHAFAKDSNDPELRHFIPLKMNLAPDRAGLVYRIVAAGGCAKVEWIRESDQTANNAVNGTPTGATPRQQTACAWLISRFRECLEWEQKTLESNGKAEDVHRSALFEAKRLLGVGAKRTGSGSYVWFVPADWPHFTEAPEGVSH